MTHLGNYVVVHCEVCLRETVEFYPEQEDLAICDFCVEKEIPNANPSGSNKSLRADFRLRVL